MEKKCFEVEWEANGIVEVEANSQEEANDMVNENPLEYMDEDDLLENFEVVR